MKIILMLLAVYLLDSLIWFSINKIYCFRFKGQNRKGCNEWACKKNTTCEFSKWYGIPKKTFKEELKDLKKWFLKTIKKIKSK